MCPCAIQWQERLAVLPSRDWQFALAPTQCDYPPAMLNDSSATVRLADVMAALSIATDLSMGQPVEHAMRTCIVAMRLGDALGFGDAELHDVYYESLLRSIGCNADTAWAASVLGDEIALRTAFAEVDTGDQRAVFETV